MSGQEKLWFSRGFVCACATMLNGHGSEQEVAYAMGCLGKVNRADVEDFDYQQFKLYHLEHLFTQPPRRQA